jgi:hypothetical protein
MTHPNQKILGNCRYALALARLHRRRLNYWQRIGHSARIRNWLAKRRRIGRHIQDWLGIQEGSANRLSRRIQIGNGWFGRRCRRLAEHPQPQPPSIATTLFSTSLLALFTGSPTATGLSTMPLLRLTPTGLAAIMTSGMGRPKESLAPFKQAMPATKSTRRPSRLLCRISTNVILTWAQGSACSQRSSLGGELPLPPRRSIH